MSRQHGAESRAAARRARRREEVFFWVNVWAGASGDEVSAISRVSARFIRFIKYLV